MTDARSMSIYLVETDATEFVSSSMWTNEIKGATLVYQSPDNWSSTAGANRITLTEPFVYSGTKNLKVLVHVSASTRLSKSTECFYTVSSGNKHQKWSLVYSGAPTSSGTLDRNRPDIKFYYSTACGVNPPVADFNPMQTSVFEGDTVTFADRSTGPAVRYNWTFDGGNPTTSTLANPEVIYMKAGTYPVNLQVTNTEGTNTKTLQQAITVSARKPVTQFQSSSDGFIKHTDSGQFLPLSGGQVQFEHHSLYYPETISWTFGGINTTSKEDNPAVNYPEGRNKYSVSLVAANSAGQHELSYQDYIQVGGTADIWNVRPGETPDQTHSVGAYVANAVGATYSKVAERFAAPAKGKITKVQVYTQNVTQSGQGYMTLAVYSNKNGLPDQPISPELKIEGGDNRINPNGYTTVTFEEAVSVSDTFHIVAGTSSASYVTFTVPAVADRKNPLLNTTSSFRRFSGLWVDLGEQNVSTSLNIVPEFTYENPTGLNPIPEAGNSLKVYPNPAAPGHAFQVTSGLDETMLQNSQIHIYTLDGRLVHRQKVTGKQTEVYLSQPGTYILRLNQEKGMVIVR